MSDDSESRRLKVERTSFASEVFHPGSQQNPINKSTVNHEVVQYFTKQLFDLSYRCVFTQLASPLDPRGYVDLYGEDTETRYEFSDGQTTITYHALACFFDHISFILEGDIDCILTPKIDGVELVIINEDNPEVITEKKIKTRSDLVKAISGYLSLHENKEAAE